MPKVRFKVAYRNGSVRVDAAAEEVVELSDEQLAYVLTDIRNPKESLEILGKRKGKAEAEGEAKAKAHAEG